MKNENRRCTGIRTIEIPLTAKAEKKSIFCWKEGAAKGVWGEMGSWGWVCAGRGGGGEGGGLGGGRGTRGMYRKKHKKRRGFDSQTSSKRSSPATLSPYTLLRPRFCSDRATFSCNESPALRQSKQKMKGCMSYLLSGNNITQFRRNDGCCLRTFGFAFGDCCDIVFGGKQQQQQQLVLWKWYTENRCCYRTGWMIPVETTCFKSVFHLKFVRTSVSSAHRLRSRCPTAQP